MAIIKEITSIGAPLFGSILGGPPGLAAGAIGLIIKTLGLSNNSSVEDITNAIQANPEAAIKLRELEAQHQQYLLSVKLQMDQAEYADRANARARELDITKATGSRDWFASGLGIFVVLGFTVVLCFMIFRPIEEEDQERDPATSAIINILVGALTAGYSTVLSYYFGSSVGSKSKDRTIANISTASPIPSPDTQLVETSPIPLMPSPEPPVQRETWRDE
jgi:hypothetical protein